MNRCEMKYSVIIISYNEENKIRESIRSVKSVPADFTDFEIIVSDGGSRDSTFQIAKDEGVIINKSPMGRGVQSNTGARLASSYLKGTIPGYPNKFTLDEGHLFETGRSAQYMAELTTAVKYNMNITHILLNNNELGKISKEQKADELTVWETNLQNPNFAEYANNCGALGIRVENKSELDSAIKKALDYSGPSMVEIITDAELI